VKAKKRISAKVIAVRKACKADGIGLSHFVLVIKPTERPVAATRAVKA
jgi:modified peptide precursor CbpA